MRIVPAMTALMVMGSLYVFIFERDALLALANAAPKEIVTDATGQDGEAPGIRVVARRSEARTIDSAVVLRGETRALRHVEVRAETSARVISEPLRKGRFVETGETLCELDPGSRDAALLEARARLAEARARIPEAQARISEANARLSEAKINDNAATRLSEGGFASDTRVAATRAAVSAAKASVQAAKTGLQTASSGIQAAEAAVASAEAERARVTIAAPFAGLLESDSAELGSLLQPGTPCATVIQLDPIKLVGFSTEAEVGRLELGARAGARLVDGTTVEGRVTFLSRSADPKTRTFQVEILVPNADLRIRDGQTAEITVSAPGTRAHLLPQSALTLNNEGQLGVRAVGEDQRVDFLPVRLLSDTKKGAWLSGLPERADVIIVGQEFVTQGVRVTPVFEEMAQ